jgi:hypothetical protein
MPQKKRISVAIFKQHLGIHRTLRRLLGLDRVLVRPYAVILCRQSNCLAENPPHARFCRRCGNPMAGGDHFPIDKSA